MRLARWVLLLSVTFSFAPRAQNPSPVIDPVRKVQNAASNGPEVAPGSFVAIFGTNFVSASVQATNIPLPTQLGDLSVTFNGTAAPLVAACHSCSFNNSLDQINAQLPWEIQPGTAQVVVTRGGVQSAAVNIQVLAVAPGLLYVATDNTGVNRPLVYNNSDNTFAYPGGIFGTSLNTRPSNIGESLILLCTGLGPVSVTPPDGAPALDANGQYVESDTLTKPVILVGGVPATVQFAGLSQYPSLYQVNFTLSPGTPGGDAVSVQIQMGGITTTDQLKIAVNAPAPPPPGTTFSTAKWGANWVRVAMPAQTTGGVETVISAGDGNIYISNKDGLFRASMSDIAATNGNPSWQALTSGLPPLGGTGPGYETTFTMLALPNGDLITGFGRPGVHCTMAKLSRGASAWSIYTGLNAHCSDRFATIEQAPDGTIFAVNHTGDIYKSTDGGSTYSTVCLNCSTLYGQAGGYTYRGHIIGGKLYWGGESPLGIATLDFKNVFFQLCGTSGANCNPGTTGYGGNIYDVASDGTQAVAPASEVLAIRSDPVNTSDIQRYDVPTGTWSPVPAMVVPGGTTTQFFQWRTLTRSQFAGNHGAGHVYYVSGARSGTVGGVMGSVDGGRTWQAIGQWFLPCTLLCVGDVVVSPSDDSKFVDVAGFIYWHP